MKFTQKLNMLVEGIDKDKKIPYLESQQFNSILDLEKIAADVAKKIQCDIHGSCVHFAELFVLKVKEENDSLLDTFNIIEGYVDTKIGDGISQQHTWIEFKDGTKIDPTFKQFSKYDEKAKYNKKGSKTYSGRYYYDETIKGTWFSERRETYPKWIFKNPNK